MDTSICTNKKVLNRTAGCMAVASHDNLLACGMRRSVIIYSISTPKVTELREILIPASPFTMHFLTSDSLCIGSRLEVTIAKIQDSVAIRLFSVPSQYTLLTSHKPVHLTYPISDHEMLCTIQSTCYRINLLNGNETNIFQWSSPPTKIYCKDYFALAQITNYLEIRILETGRLLQQIEFGSGNTLNLNSTICAFNSTSLWKLSAYPYEDVVSQLVKLDKYEDAELFINEIQFEDPKVRSALVFGVRSLYATYLFRVEKKFGEAIRVMEETNVFPGDVIGNFPEFAHDCFDADSNEIKRKGWADSDLEAVQYLAEYLERVRKSPVKDSDFIRTFPKPSQETPTYLLELVDTTLLKCYILTKDSANLLLLMRKPNYCALETTEQVLNSECKIVELLEFLKSRGMFRKALEIIKSSGLVPDPFGNMVKLLKRVQKVDPNGNLDLVFEYAKQVLIEDGNLAIGIFVSDICTDYDYKCRVFTYLDEISVRLSTKFLEFVVDEQRDKTVVFSNWLLLKYVQLYRLETELGIDGSLAIKERDRVGVFVTCNCVYDYEYALEIIPGDGELCFIPGVFFNETTFILAKLCRFKEALQIILLDLEDFAKSQLFCEQNYRDDVKCGDIFNILFGLCVEQVNQSTMEMGTLVGMINKYGNYLDGEVVVGRLPETIELSRISEFLRKCLSSTTSKRHKVQVLQNLMRTRLVSVKSQLYKNFGTKIVVTEDTMCHVCVKRISSTIFTVLPDSKVAHTFCVNTRK